MKTKILLLSLAAMMAAGNSWGQACSTPTCGQPGHTIQTNGMAAPPYCIQTASGTCSSAIGDTVIASGTASVAIGSKVTAGSAANTICMGLGLLGNPLVNNSAKSLMVGFDSDVPTVFVGPGSGSSGSFGNVGIATTSPGYRLDVNSGDINAITTTKGYRIGGNYVLWHNGTTSDIFVGVSAGNSSMSGHNNTLMGNGAGDAMTSGLDNVMIGKDAGTANTTSGYNVFVGSQAGLANTTGGRNTFVGYEAGKSNTTGLFNTFIGQKACSLSVAGDKIVAVGYEAGKNNTASFNVFVGTWAGSNNIDGIYNTYLGYDCGSNTTTADSNTYVGHNAGYYNVSGDGNTICGITAGRGVSNNSYSHNSYFGNRAGYSTSTGSANTAVGTKAGYAITTGSNNTFLGYGADASSATLTNATAIGYGTVVCASNEMLFGDGNVTKWGFGVCPAAGNAIEVGNSTSNGNGANLTNGGAWTNGSARAFKDNITELDGKEILNKVKQLEVAKWKYKGTEEYHIGPFAEEFAQLFNVGIDNKHISTIDPAGVALAAIKELIKGQMEQKKLIEDLQKEIEKNKTFPGDSEQQLNNDGENATLLKVGLANKEQIILYQNEPNPFSNITSIRYFLPEGHNSFETFIVFNNEFGKELNKIQLSGSGLGKIEVETSQLMNGIYSYSIVVNGKVMDSRKMIKQ